jgi:hypothetical protein
MRYFFKWRNKWKSLGYHKQQQLFCEFLLDVYLLRWEIEWGNTPRIWRDFGSVLPFQTRFTQTKRVLPLSKEHGSYLKDQGGPQCCHNKHKKFPYRSTRDVSLLSIHASYLPCKWYWPALGSPNFLLSGFWGKSSRLVKLMGHAVAQLVETLCYKSEGNGFDDVFGIFDIFLPAKLWPWVRLSL